MKKILKVLPLCLLMLGVASCSGEKSSSSSSAVTPTSSSETPKTSSSSKTETPVTTSSEEEKPTSSSEEEKVVIEEHDFETIEKAALEQNLITAGYADKAKPGFPLTIGSVTYPSTMQFRVGKNNRSYVDYSGNEIAAFPTGSERRVDNIKVLTFTTTQPNTHLYLSWFNSSSSNGAYLSFATATTGTDGTVTYTANDLNSDWCVPNTNNATDEQKKSQYINYTFAEAGTYYLCTFKCSETTGEYDESAANQGSICLNYIALVPNYTAPTTTD